MSIFIMSDEYPQLCKAMQNSGHIVIPSDKILCFNQPEQRHIDMQMLKIKNNIFLLKEARSLYKKLQVLDYNVILTEKTATGKYPECVLLNALFLDNKLYCKEVSLDANVKDFCKENNIEIVNVNQGYTACSTAVISEKAVITADDSIYNTLTNNGIDVLKISSGYIQLKGYNYGFIGGACTQINENSVAFFGDITLHPDYKAIKKFCTIHNIKILSLEKGRTLTDAGGAIKL